MSEALLANPEAFLGQLLFAMLRAGGAFLAAPIFAAMAMPLQLRILLAAAIAVAVLATTPIAPPPLLSAAGLLAVAGEVVVGLALGFLLQLALAGPLVAGEQIAAGAGLGFAAVNDPQSGAQSPAVSNFLMILMTLLFLALDGHLFLIEALVRSYRAFPPGDAWPERARLFDIVTFGGFVFAGGLLVALPVAMTLFATNLALGILTRTAPQMNIFAVGLPISVMVAMLMLALAFPAIVEVMTGAIETGLERLTLLAAGR